MYKVAYEQPNVDVLYLAKTRQLAKDKFYIPILKKALAKRFKLHCKFNDSELSVELPNGSKIHCYGADASVDEVEKLLGGKHPLIVLDEAQSWRQDLRDLVYAKLRPTTTDYLGTICLLGTPGNFTRGLFFDITQDPPLETAYPWKVFKWSVHDNPYMADKIAIELAELLAANPLIVETPAYRQMWLGEWVIEKDKLIYKFSWDRQCKEVSKPERFDEYMLAVDLGYDDASAFVVAGWNNTDKRLYYLEAYKESNLTFDQVAKRVQHYMDLYKIQNNVIVDGANKQGIETMRQRYNLPFKSAEKQGKFEYISLMNSDFITGRIKVVESGCELLIEEWEGLVRDDRSDKWKEHPACPNHLCDAALYLWREARNWLSEEAKPIVKLTYKERLAQMRQQDEEMVDTYWEKEDYRIHREKQEWLTEALDLDDDPY